MVKPEPKWVAKWRELERLVDRKYEGYISVVGLRMTQYNEAAIRYFHIDLVIYHRHFFFLSDANSRLRAIRKAINVVKHNGELRTSLVHFSLRPTTPKEIRGLAAIINNCRLTKSAP